MFLNYGNSFLGKLMLTSHIYYRTSTLLMALHSYFTPVTSLPTTNALHMSVRVDENIKVEI